MTAVGLWQMHRRPELSTRLALGPGLTLALLPSLLWILADEDTDLRVLLLGLACLGLVLVGATLRWSAPLVLGAVVGAVVAVRESAPYVDAAVPRWSLLALAGAVLVGVALTWESRMADARRAVGVPRPTALSGAAGHGNEATGRNPSPRPACSACWVVRGAGVERQSLSA